MQDCIALETIELFLNSISANSTAVSLTTEESAVADERNRADASAKKTFIAFLVCFPSYDISQIESSLD